MDFFDAHSVFFTVFGYKLSYLEFFAVITGIVSVVLSAKASVWSWPVGIINVFLSAFLYYQSQLYPDMFLMVFFFVTNIMGWWRWTNPKPEEEDRNKELKISFMPLRQFMYLLAVGIFGTLLIGTLAGELHNWLPLLFNLPSAYPFVDSFIFVMSVITTFLMIQKRVECWIIWLIIDIVATYLYFLKGIKFMGIEYFIFTIIAGFALWNWIKECKGYSKTISNTEDL